MKKTICLIQIFLLVWIPFSVHAGPFEDFAADGQSEGRDFVPDTSSLFGQDASSGDFTFNPGTTGEISISPTDLFSGQTGYDPQDAKDQFDSDAGVTNLGDAEGTALETEMSSAGEAWRLLIDSQHSSHPDLRNDPIWATTDAVLAEAFSGSFQDCTETTNVIPTTQTVHMPEYHTCERITNPSGACTINHNYSASWDLISGDPSDFCVPGYVQDSHTCPFPITGGNALNMNISCPSEVQDEIIVNYVFMGWCGWNYVSSWQTATINVDGGVPTVGTPGVIDIWSGSTVAIKDSPNLLGADYYRRGCFLELRGGACDGDGCDLDFRFVDSYNWDDSYYADRTYDFTLSAKPPGTYTKTVVDEWSPQSCIDDSQAILDSGFCNAEAVCVSGPPEEYTCTTPPGSISVCTLDLAPSPVPGISNLCETVEVNVTDCDWNIGPMDCYTDASGLLQCPVNDGTNTNSCVSYEADPSCAYIRSDCIEGLEGASGICYGWEDLYDCGYDVTTTTNLIEKFYECEGDTRCVESGGPGSDGASPSDLSGSLSNIETCHQGYLPPDETLTVLHDYEVELIRLIGGAGSISSCGVGCLNIWVGQVGDNYWSGSCAIHEQATNLEITNTDVFTSAVIDNARWDDYMQIYMNSNKVWQGPNSNFPPETGGSCELGTSWNQNPNVDVTSYFQNAGFLDFLTRVSVTGGGEGYSHITAHYDPSKVLRNDVWEMSEKLRTALEHSTTSGCSVTAICVEDPIPATDSCAMYNGYQICKSDFGPMPAGLESISPSCRKVEVVYDCSTSNTASLSTCDDLENAGCGFLSGNCVPGYYDSIDDICWLEEREYDCTTPLTPTSTTEALVCGIQCIGTECVSHDPLISTDFARAAAMMQAAEYIGQDMECADSSAGGICSVFGGEVYECKKALGGWVDCCESPGGISLKDYIDLLQAGNKVASAEQWLGSINNPVAGAWNGAKDIAVEGWESVSDSVSQAFTKLTEPFTAAWEGIAGTASEVATDVTPEVAEAAAGGFVQTLTNTTAQWVMDTFGAGAVDAMFSTTGASAVAADGGAVAASEALAEEGASAALELGGTILGPILWAYMIYSIVNILVHLIWKCEQREFELGAKKQLKVCHYVGSYCSNDTAFGCIEKREAFCCFNSPMSRILQEQIRPQLGLSWGSPESPNCEGIPVVSLDSVDWNLVDLSEWIAILSITDNNPQINADLLSMENMTGSGNALDDAVPDTPRDDVLERTLDRLDGYDATDTNENMSQGLYGN